jgi:hypothetical protein
MPSLPISDSFHDSYQKCETYPCNLVHQTSYSGALQAYRDRLNNVSSNLFTSTEDEILIPFRDLLPNEQGDLSCHSTRDQRAD